MIKNINIKNNLKLTFSIDNISHNISTYEDELYKAKYLTYFFQYYLKYFNFSNFCFQKYNITLSYKY